MVKKKLCLILPSDVPVFMLFSPELFFQLSKFVCDERQRKTIYPTPENVFSWTRACDIKDVSFFNKTLLFIIVHVLWYTSITSYGLRQANLVLIAYASSEGSGESAHPRSLARTSAARSYKQ